MEYAGPLRVKKARERLDRIVAVMADVAANQCEEIRNEIDGQRGQDGL